MHKVIVALALGVPAAAPAAHEPPGLLGFRSEAELRALLRGLAAADRAGVPSGPLPPPIVAPPPPPPMGPH